MTDRELRGLRRSADYQFGRGAGATLFTPADDLEVTHTSSGRPRQVHDGDGRVVTYGNDGRFRLGPAGGARLADGFAAPRHRVVVGDESEPFVREGRNVFAKFVQQADPELRPGDEALVMHAEGTLLAVGRAELPGDGMADFETGMAVKVRQGIEG
ncbi:PUA domain-containing protein [Haloarcula sp. GH36]|uniref:PUA domain-containing protein n=1 Tax=Haloarcula montana TaxID=3111776 RepID=UPI002D7828AB|nr:PUA domain-containing protein [Haloarcula sp. GH36]